jgi:outer membrane autotransporter protein
MTSASAGALLAAGTGHAANPAFQAFFFSVCGASTSGELATRCGQTPGGLGNLSGDSESSMNPSQGLSHNQSPIATAQSHGRDARDREAGEAGGTDSVARVEVGPFSLMAHVNGGSFERDVANDLERAYEGDDRGLELGFDYRASPNTVLGLLVGASRTDFDFVAENPGVNFTPQANAGGADVDTYYLTGFASFSLGSKGYIDVAAGYDQSSQELRRNPVFQESTRTVTQVNGVLTADADGSTTWSSVNGGMDFGGGAFTFGMYLGATYARADLDGYTERDVNNTGLAMTFSGTDRESMQGHAGLRMAYTFSTGNGVVVPQLRVEYQHEFEDRGDAVTTNFVLDPDASGFELGGALRDASAIEAGLGITAMFANGWQTFLNVDVLTGSEDLDRSRVTLGVRVEL